MKLFYNFHEMLKGNTPAEKALCIIETHFSPHSQSESLNERESE